MKGTEGLEFVRRDGHHLLRALATQFAETEYPNGNLAIEAEDDALGVRIDARTAVTRWLGESMDYGFAVSTLMDIAERVPFAGNKSSAILVAQYPQDNNNAKGI